MFTTSILPDAFARAFAELPPKPIWDWADRTVWLVSQSATESGLYRSAKTPWTRRMQEVARELVMPVWSWKESRWVWVSVREYTAMKSSQAGLSEGALNIVRWRAKHDPCNVIYGIDTREEAKNIVERLIPTLADIDPGIFTGDDDDVGTYVARLRDMIVWFIGSFSTGKFANKQAPLRILDEIEEHGSKGTIRELQSRGKTADDGLQINLSKPKFSGGPIHKAYERGNQEHYFFRCPACQHVQWPSFFETAVETCMDFQNLQEVQHPNGRTVLLPTPYPEGQTRPIRTSQVVFDHCRTPLGEWDKLRMLDEAAIQCAGCGHLIAENEKRALMQTAWWMPTAHGTPGSISQQISDLFSSDLASSLGHLSMEYLDAKKEGLDGIAKFYNHRLGLPYTHEVNVTRETDIRANIAGASEGDACEPFKRGTVPFTPSCLILGGDVGGNYAKWALGAVHQNLADVAVIDWGEELDPNAVAEIINTKTWPMASDGKPVRIYYGFMDAKFRKSEVYRACLAVPGRRLIPTAGLGGAAARSGKAWSYHQVATYQKSLKELTYNDRDAKDELYVARLKKRRSRIWFPIDVMGDPEFVQELCAEELIRDDHGRTKWNEHPGANHYGDCVKDIITGLRFLTRKQQVQTGEAPSTPSVAAEG